MTKTEEDKMKQWKLVLVALLSLLLVCGCMSAMAADTTPPQHTHEMEITSQTAATCTTDGSIVRTCKVVDCGYTTTEKIPATGHKWGAWSVKTAADCQTNLVEERACLNGCGETQQQTGAKGDHKWENKEAKAPDCENAGYTAYKVCTVCNVEQGKKEVKALGHDYSIQTAFTDSTCAAEGSKTMKCTRCDSTKDVPVAKKPHTFSNTYDKNVVVNAATCTTTGVGIRVCKECGVQEGANYTIAKLGHKFDLKATPDETKAADCENDGLKTWLCKNGCGEKKTEVIKKTGHKLSDKIVTPAGCTTDGYKTIECANANCPTYPKYNVVIKATGHKGEWKVDKKATPTEDGLRIKYCVNKLPDGTVCGQELDRQVIKYSEMLYNNTITSVGPCTRDLVGGKDWYRVTPIDLSVEGTFTYDLIASNKYVVGTATVTIANGTLTVSYNLNASHIKVNSEALIVYPNLDALRNPTPANTVNATFGAPIDIAATFGEDTKVMLSVYLKADYNEIGAGVYGFKVNQAQIDAMAAIID